MKSFRLPWLLSGEQTGELQEWKQGNKSFIAGSVLGERSWCPDVSSDFLTSGNVKVYRKWKNGDTAWLSSVLDVLSLRCQ